ncbi:DUF4249 domain-containing protein [Hymenobacter sp. GOD-10R]|uniref:DUF4249 domain-containing protein n=1 Tax=Hymenobacter sp. GOD-10R TaxID=3093922 RepID=UPI002D7673A1|nr:DUF4249 domain-containing protein [Hymenobacter sp. GOD-10R]WRQ28167.1 DUF4249 domain-containing protein [Hymenobacter sp. GOD-10R]
MRIILPLFRVVFLCCLALLLPGCIDSYMPDAINATKSYLVVDGLINSQGITTITLSRTYDIDAKTPAPVESGATLYVEDEAAARYTLLESTTKGTYTSSNQTLSPAKRYRLHIRTKGGKEYTSDYVTVKSTPPIDNVSWKPTNSGLNIYVNSHDDANNTRYYRWSYEETWEIRPLLVPSVEYLNRKMQDIRQPYPQACWITEKSTNIILGNTSSLGRDVVSDQLLRSFSTTSDRLYVKYSILVRQYAQTKEEYEYWSLLKKNTENIGTLFDPLPAQLTGNMHCLNDDTELALGYVGAGSVQEKRILISRGQLPPTWRLQAGYESCVPPDTVSLTNVDNTFTNPVVIPVGPVFSSTGSLKGYTQSSAECVDCRKRGSAVRPIFWQ